MIPVSIARCSVRQIPALRGRIEPVPAVVVDHRRRDLDDEEGPLDGPGPDEDEDEAMRWPAGGPGRW